MVVLFDGPVSPDALTTFVREVPVNSDLAFLREFPVLPTDKNYVDFAEIVRTNRTARYRNFDGRLHVSERDTGSERRVKLPPLSSSLVMGEYERLQLEFARTGGTNRAALANAVYNDAENLTREVQARLELAWGDTLTDGKFTFLGASGEPAGEADFGVPVTQIVAPAGALWSNLAAAVPFTDVRTWFDVLRAAGNAGIQMEIRTSLRMMRYFQRNTEVINAIKGAQTGSTYVTLSDVNALLASDGLPQFGEPLDSSVDVDGVSTRIVPDDRVLILPVDKRQLGYLSTGITVTALELVESNQSDLAFSDAPGIVGVVEHSGPPTKKFTYVDCVAMPILANARRLLIADAA